jgi:hypothetical protein
LAGGLALIDEFLFPEEKVEAEADRAEQEQAEKPRPFLHRQYFRPARP